MIDYSDLRINQLHDLQRSSWRTREELDYAKKVRGYYAKLNAEKAQVKVRNSNFDGEILKRRDKS